MGSARGKYEISAELAIKREIAYCEHLELMQLIKSTEAKQVPAPFNPTSMPASRPTSETIQTRPSQIPNPRPKLSENSSPNPTRKIGSSFSNSLKTLRITQNSPKLNVIPFFRFNEIKEETKVNRLVKQEIELN